MMSQPKDLITSNVKGVFWNEHAWKFFSRILTVFNTDIFNQHATFGKPCLVINSSCSNVSQWRWLRNAWRECISFNRSSEWGGSVRMSHGSLQRKVLGNHFRIKAKFRLPENNSILWCMSKFQSKFQITSSRQGRLGKKLKSIIVISKFSVWDCCLVLRIFFQSSSGWEYSTHLKNREIDFLRYQFSFANKRVSL